MKVALVIVFLNFALSSYAGEKWNSFFLKQDINLGKINSKKKIVIINFYYCNNTKSVVSIIKIRTSCGCTNVYYPHHPLKTNESGNIKVTLDLNYINGYFKKSLLVYLNKGNPILLKFKGIKQSYYEK